MKPAVIIEGHAVPETGHLEINLHVSVEVVITAQEARQRVTGFLTDRISYLMHGGEPQLLIASQGHDGQQVCWRVPVLLAFPSYGPVGTVGHIDVDVASGQLSTRPEQIIQIEANARELAARLSLETTPAG